MGNLYNRTNLLKETIEYLDEQEVNEENAV